MTDVTILINESGSLIGFTTHTDAANEWFADNVAADAWQWLGNTLWVDHRAAPAVANGLVAAGLEIE
jgi:hypothetical protein